jgi:MEMO1 family protein
MEAAEYTGKRLRYPVVAGAFYPAYAKELSREIEGYLRAAPPRRISDRPIGLICPHAGYLYSGHVAACAYKQIEGLHYDVVVVIAPSHRVYFSGASLDTREGYVTPLGVVPVDKEFSAELMKRSPLFQDFPPAHSQEHSLEVQIPFLQSVLKDFTLVPLVMGDQDLRTCEQIAGTLADAFADRNVLVVASSDLSHYHPHDEAKGLDQKVLESIDRYDPRGLASELGRHRTEACGGGPIITALLIGERLGAPKAQVIKYAHSGEISGDYSAVVGYVAAVIYSAAPASHEKKREARKAGIDLGLTEEEKEILHKIARDSIRSHLERTPPSVFTVESATLQEPRGAFVSLHERGMLRGCIGHIRPDQPLHETIGAMACAAAFEDPRFSPLTREEADLVDIEISVLTPFRKITDPNEIEVGTHGIYLVKGFRSGILLPQVATEYGWDRSAFLAHTCTKAGLPEDAWKDPDTEMYIFSADVF